MGWKGESRRHSLSRKGIKTNLPDGRRFDVSNFVARGNEISNKYSEDELVEIVQSRYPNISYDDAYRVMRDSKSYILGTVNDNNISQFRLNVAFNVKGRNLDASGNIKHFGSQAREKIEDTDEKYRLVSKKGKEAVLFNPDSNTYERWYKNDDYAGHVIEIDGAGYEFANSMKKGHVFKVWSGRYSKIVEAKDHADAIKKSEYVDADQVDRIG